MDVRCERCSTEYEFDDALVSGRGTTVKCTNCGHKFKIRRSDGDFSEDFWNVQTGDGRTLVFTSLRELQRAIQTNLVERSDLLSRGGLKQKPIGQIPELAPFFDQRDQRKSLTPAAAAPPVAPAAPAATASAPPAPASRDSADTMVAARPAGGAGAPKRSSRPPPPPGTSAPPLAAPPRQRMSTRPDFPPMPPERSELPAPGAAAPTVATKTLIGTGGGDLPTREVPAVAQRDSLAASSSAPTPVRTEVAEPATSSHPTRVREPAPAAATPPSVEPLPPPPAMRERLGSLRPSETPPSTEREPEPDTQRFARGADESVPEAPAAVPHTRTQPLDAPLYLPKTTSSPPVFEASSPLPAPTGPVLRTMNLDADEPPENSDGVRGRTLSDAPHSMGRRRSVGGYIVAAVVLAGGALIGAIWAKDHLGGVLGNRPPPVATADPRVAGFLATGEKALADGNVEVAKESFDKASALAEKDARVLLDVARLAAVRADLPWLKSRLLLPDAADDNRLTKDELAERSTAARKAADDALAVAPDDPAALRAKIDALRIGGDREGARALVARVATSASQPETAYVLATLDLAENEPLWSTVIERLRVAASAESGPGRGRAALVYALARSGDVAGAKAEVERLASMSRQHPLLPLLRGFADRAKPVVKPDASLTDGGIAAGVDAGRLRPGERGDPGERGEKASAGGKNGVSGDARQLVAQGEKARAKGDFDRAQQLYAAALDRNPNDTEALNGLAAIAHARRDLNGARASYKRVLSINPSYVPALVGVGDVDWESGDRASAMKTYKEIVERFPEGTYPARVKQRVDAASGGGGGASSGGASSGGTAPAPTPAPSDTGGGG